jgi:hypothetical protein
MVTLVPIDKTTGYPLVAHLEETALLGTAQGYSLGSRQSGTQCSTIRPSSYET